jgi:multidrug efflux pump subunit AcrA (membrane-fusion protein)
MTSPSIRTASGPTHGAARRTGISPFVVLGILVAVALLAGMAWYTFGRRGKDSEDVPLLQLVTRGPYQHIVLEQGEVESSNNVEIRCEVRARTTSSGPSTSIIDIVTEGTHVKEGDWLITFDSSALEQEQRQQKIAVNSAEAVMIQAKALYDTAVIAKKEYEEGTFRELEKTILNEIFVAEENLKKAQLSYDSVKRLVSRGLLTTLQLEGEQFRVEAATNELALGKQKLEVLKLYTLEKMLTQLESDIQAAEVTWRNEQDTYNEEMTKLNEIEDQIAKCRVTAPQAGQVVYANVQSSRSSSEFVVEPGVLVRERQVIIRLPDPSQMQIQAKINESRINLVHEGMPVDIRIDAFGEMSLDGQVVKVNKYAEPGNFWSSSSKQYATSIEIHDPPPEIRVGMTAAVQIQVERRPDALQIPVQAVYEKEGATFCLVQNGERWDTRKIVIGSTNDKTVALDEKQGEMLLEGELVVMNPRRHLDKFDATRFPKAVEKKTAAAGIADDGTGSTKGSPRQPEVDRQAAGGPGGAASPAQALQRWDANQDGTLSADELNAVPTAYRGRVSSADANSDGAIDTAELGNAMAQLRLTSEPSLADAPGGGS